LGEVKAQGEPVGRVERSGATERRVRGHKGHMIIAEWMGEKAKHYRGLMSKEVERDADQKRMTMFFCSLFPHWFA
jgi:hypothetical protein